MKRRSLTGLALAIAFGMTVAACGDDSSSSSTTTGAAGPTTASTESVTLRLGYFPNITHAPALVGLQDGIFANALGANVKLETKSFDAGPEAVEALFSGAIDATFIGPNPAINAFVKSKGKAIRIVSGTTSGGAYFVVKPEISGATDLEGKKIASPQLGGTQDVALRSWLKEQGLESNTSGGGDVSIVPQANADTLTAFKAGDIAGAWVPEPWATRLIQEGGGKVLIDEKTLWPQGKYVTTHLIVDTKFLAKHPDTIKKLLAGLADSVDAIAADPVKAQASANAAINAATGKPLKDEVITAAFKNLEFTLDPIASSLEKSAKDAEAVGLLDSAGLKGIYDLKLLNEVLKERGKPAATGF
ncbi:MAG: ABC transporter substrate-binding protein [Acidimicrobiia bacterium]